MINDNWKLGLRRTPDLKCEDCGKTSKQALAGDYPQPLDRCPECGKVVCNVCSEREGSFCCDGGGRLEAFDLEALT